MSHGIRLLLCAHAILHCIWKPIRPLNSGIWLNLSSSVLRTTAFSRTATCHCWFIGTRSQRKRKIALPSLNNALLRTIGRIRGETASTPSLIITAQRMKRWEFIAVLRLCDLAASAGVPHQKISASEDFAVVGAYPDGREWDLLRGLPGERPKSDHNIAALPIPDNDPIYGADGPLRQIWKAARGK